MNKLYSNIGNKIQILAKISGFIGVAGGCICVLIDLFTGFSHYDGIMFACGLGGALICLIGSWFLYAFGQVTNDVHKIAGNDSEQVPEDEIPEI